MLEERKWAEEGWMVGEDWVRWGRVLRILGKGAGEGKGHGKGLRGGEEKDKEKGIEEEEKQKNVFLKGGKGAKE